MLAPRHQGGPVGCLWHWAQPQASLDVAASVGDRAAVDLARSWLSLGNAGPRLRLGRQGRMTGRVRIRECTCPRHPAKESGSLSCPRNPLEAIDSNRAATPAAANNANTDVASAAACGAAANTDHDNYNDN